MCVVHTQLRFLHAVYGPAPHELYDKVSHLHPQVSIAATLACSIQMFEGVTRQFAVSTQAEFQLVFYSATAAITAISGIYMVWSLVLHAP